jgi:uncharacterized spore protein YtfJ
LEVIDVTTNGRTAVEDLVGKVSQVHERASVKTVFGDPIQIEGRTVIPVAKVGYGFGVGMGRGGLEKEGSGEGGGGGGGLSVRPVAVLEVKDDAVRVKPIPDVTRLAMAGMALAAWSVFWITMTIRAAMRKRA